MVWCELVWCELVWCELVWCELVWWEAVVRSTVCSADEHHQWAALVWAVSKPCALGVNSGWIDYALTGS